MDQSKLFCVYPTPPRLSVSTSFFCEAAPQGLEGKNKKKHKQQLVGHHSRGGVPLFLLWFVVCTDCVLCVARRGLVLARGQIQFSSFL